MLEQLIEAVVILSCIAFLLFLIPGKHQKYVASTGWITMEAVLLLMFPHFFEEGNFVYPIIAIAALPCIYITVKRLLMEDYYIRRLTYAASIAYLIYAPFAFIPALGNWLISVVVDLVAVVLTAIGTPYTMSAWNIFMGEVLPGNTFGFQVEVILGCTGIQAIAILLGVVAIIPSSWKRKIALFFLVTIPIFVVNIFRNVYVVTAYTQQWYPWFQEWFPEPEMYGYASFFWAHNVFCELLAVVVLIGIAYLLFKLNPTMVTTLRDIGVVYYEELTAMRDRIFGRKSIE
ncbi:archaeosortase A [Methanocorpusculum vombati]|uniref:Archaeosortase A n=1 Tax=Methanocorpusculum vombati TaxID=3002864 RepID=A0ABT4INI9_9EURY|nr:archaeosortase A [Methanocorpusculum vombati]MCZ9319706.1 archaeosortase A [Methanocorpusculum sp.]MCZ0862812.1 archaeosortase A [Methanocorpusculum vombati]MDE2520726.1 archaeosortase A [Methanocorpusculum sp.]MDE2533768.1 archaeosortase A [Methanocorpusculum sp.]MDE2546628.1 archaeosortase A [Methanocorpusculum sp.]